MKKMIAILALCAFVSLSNAAIMFTASGGTVKYEGGIWSVDENTSFSINLVTDADGVYGYTLGAVIIGNAAGYSTPVSYIGAAASVAGAVQTANAYNLAVWKASGTHTSGVFTNAGGTIWSIQVTAGAAGTVINVDDYVGLSSGVGMGGSAPATRINGVAAALDGISVNVVPEPITMALLGLGGLFIRRRHA